MSVDVLLVRHAEPANPQRIFYGRLPRFRLSAVGRVQADAVARFLAALPVRHVYASPLLRTRQTARIIAARRPGAALHLARPLIEVRTSYEGEPMSSLPPPYNYYDPPRDPADESLARIFARVDGFVRRLVRLHPGETVVCVSHGDPIRVLDVSYRGLPLTLESMRGPRYPGLASVLRVRFRSPEDPRPRVVRLFAP